MSLLLLFLGGHRGGHTYVEHPARARLKERQKYDAQLAARQLEEGRRLRAEEAAARELARLRQSVQDALNNRIAIDAGRGNVADAALLQRQQQDEEEAVILLLLS